MVLFLSFSGLRGGGSSGPFSMGRSGGPFGGGVRQGLPWTMALIGVSIVLALIGSVDVGHAFAGSRVAAGATVVKITMQKKAPPVPVQEGSRVGPTPTAISVMPTPMPTPVPIIQPEQPAMPVAGDPMLVVQDSFARMDQHAWGSTGGGSTWQGDATAAKIFSVRKGKGVITNANGSYNAIIGPQMTDAMILMSGSTNCVGRTSISALLRWQNANNWYKAYVDGNVLGIRKFVNGQVVTLASIPFNTQQDVVYTLRFRVKQSTLSASVWRSDKPEPQQWMLSASDTTFSSGRGGIRVGVGDNTAIHITSFAEFRV